MHRFIYGEERTQRTLLPNRLEDYVSEENPVRVIEVFIDELDLAALGFSGMTPAATGRLAYHPSTLLKIYLYGYLNRVQSSRRLERERITAPPRAHARAWKLCLKPNVLLGRPAVRLRAGATHQHGPLRVGQAISLEEGFDGLLIGDDGERACPVRPPQAAIETPGIEHAGGLSAGSPEILATAAPPDSRRSV